MDVAMSFLPVDDTLPPRCGLKIFGTGMHRDPRHSSRGQVPARWGHCHVVLCVIVVSWHRPGWCFALPVLSQLYLDLASARKWQRPYHTRKN